MDNPTASERFWREILERERKGEGEKHLGLATHKCMNGNYERSLEVDFLKFFIYNWNIFKHERCQTGLHLVIL